MNRMAITWNATTSAARADLYLSRACLALLLALAGGCITATVPHRLKAGVRSSKVHVRRESVVRLRAYAVGDPAIRREARELFLVALDDKDARVRELAALSLNSFLDDDVAYEKLKERSGREREGSPTRKVMSEMLARFRVKGFSYRKP